MTTIRPFVFALAMLTLSSAACSDEGGGSGGGGGGGLGTPTYECETETCAGGDTDLELESCCTESPPFECEYRAGGEVYPCDGTDCTNAAVDVVQEYCQGGGPADAGS